MTFLFVLHRGGKNSIREKNLNQSKKNHRADVKQNHFEIFIFFFFLLWLTMSNKGEISSWKYNPICFEFRPSSRFFSSFSLLLLLFYHFFSFQFIIAVIIGTIWFDIFRLRPAFLPSFNKLAESYINEVWYDSVSPWNNQILKQGSKAFKL